MRNYVKELDIELKKIEEETEKKLAELEREREAREERYRREAREKEESKKKLSYKIPMLILKILVFFLIVGFAMAAGIYYFIIALIISWFVGLVFIKIF